MRHIKPLMNDDRIDDLLWRMFNIMANKASHGFLTENERILLVNITHQITRYDRRAPTILINRTVWDGVKIDQFSHSLETGEVYGTAVSGGEALVDSMILVDGAKPMSGCKREDFLLAVEYGGIKRLQASVRFKLESISLGNKNNYDLPSESDTTRFTYYFYGHTIKE